jgi:2,4-dienoyl-CoA reductase-like NADH-dependent reductase (Old Yellow Enzyme family)
VKNRARFAVNIIRRIREEVGSYPVIFRMNGFENVVGGITMDEGIEIARIMEEAGANIIHPSCVVDATYNPGLPPIFSEDDMPEFLEGYPYDSCIPIADKIKPHVNCPVIGVGMIRDAASAREAIKNDTCDLLAIGRGLLADPDFARKTLANQDSEIIRWQD